MSPQVTDSATCEHAVIVTLRYLDDDDTEYAGKVAMWACADCRLRFSPGRSDVPLPDPALLGLYPAIIGIEALTAERDEAVRERDLALAHDTQPYPTAWAYEQACRVRDEAWVALDNLLRAMDQYERDWMTTHTGYTPVSAAIAEARAALAQPEREAE